jgi:large subunit ribosomal protein L25
MSDLAINAVSRQTTGKKFAKQLRRDGKIPGIFYAHGEEEIKLTFDHKDVKKLMGIEVSLIDVSIDKKKAKKCIVKEIQSDPVTGRPVHLDVMGVSLTEKITVTIPVHLKGEPIGVKEEGGTLTFSLHELEISCLPLDLPENVIIDVAELKLGDSIHVRDIKIDKVEILNDSEVSIVSVTKTRAAKIGEDAEVPTAEEGAAAQPTETKQEKE